MLHRGALLFVWQCESLMDERYENIILTHFVGVFCGSLATQGSNIFNVVLYQLVG